MYPNVTLQIKHQKPSIIFYPKESEKKVLTENKEDFGDVVIAIGKKLDLLNEIAGKINDKDIMVENLLQLARESDETKINSFIDIDIESLEFNLLDSVTKLIDSAMAENIDFTGIVDVPLAVKNELVKNQNADILASSMDAIYNILISKTILAAEQLGIGKIKLEDDSSNIRLYEKMAKELDKMGLELSVETSE